ncbi:uncharacterized protein LOC127750743 [Frankliniella occidentalis]|uniref:oleoyl-[acyl-carrier-protein] hydrolase n=1 Tax=Frankliniella occidentalis TaxID=133901 RepID=A0A9C6X4S0_FRAOC|nr:uncharacterized protein LOC127750743 [Frankliniella occidentalis]
MTKLSCNPVLGLSVSGRPRPDAFSFTPLDSAASKGRTDVLKSLLRCYDVNYISNGKIAPLDHAGLGGHEDAVRVLLQAGARYDLLTGGVDRKMGPQSPLYHAATSGSAATVGLFLQPPPPLLPQPSDTDCWVALDHAGFLGHVDVARALIDKLHGHRRGAAIDCDVGHEAALGIAKGGSVEVASALLDWWPEAVNLRISIEDGAMLHTAAMYGHVELVKLLLGRGADLLQRNRKSWTALHNAAAGGNVEVINALWEHEHTQRSSTYRKLKLHNLWNGLGERTSALCVAAIYGQLEAAKRLVDLGADMNTWKLISAHETPLYFAAREGHAPVVEWLIAQGARLHGEEAADTPLHAAAENGRLAVVQVLLPALNKLKKGEAPKRLALLQHLSSHGYTEGEITWVRSVRAISGISAAISVISRLFRIISGYFAVFLCISGVFRDYFTDYFASISGLFRSILPLFRIISQVIFPSRHTALHLAATSGSLWVVRHLLTREVQLLEKHYKNRLKAGKSPVWGDFTVYRRCWQDWTPLGFCAMSEAPSAVFRALLGHMEDERVMALGGEDAQTVREMVQEVLDGIAQRKLPWKRVIKELNASLARLRRWEALRYLLKSIGSEDVTDQPITLPNKAPQDSEDSIAPVFLIPGIEGMAVMLQSLCEYIKAPTLVLQLPYTDEKSTTIQDFARSVYKHIKSHLAPKASFKLVGYSFGGMVSTELVRLLEQDGHVGELVLLDGAPAGMQELTKVWIKEDGNTTELEMDVLVRLWFLTNQSDFDNFRCPLETQDRLCKESSLERRLRQIIPKKSKTAAHSKKGMAAAFRSFVNRIVAVNNYRPPSSAKKLRSTVTLIRPTSQTFKHDQEDCGLTDLFAQDTIPVHFVEGDHNTMLDNVETAAIINAVLVEGTAGNKTFGDKVAADSRLSAKSQ